MKSVTTDKPRAKPQARSKEKLDKGWKVVVHDDPVNTMLYVTWAFQKVFGYSREKAEILMMEVHESKKAIVWLGVREKAEMYIQQLHGLQLHAGLEREE